MGEVNLERLATLLSFLEKFRQIERQLHTANASRLENDAEHSFNLAMLAWFLAVGREDLDESRVIKLALAHDLVEVFAGDAAFFNTKQMEQKERLESKALIRIRAEWQDFEELPSLIQEYKQRKTVEAKFVYALDKLLPLLNNYLTDAASWQQFKVPYESLKAYKGPKAALDPQVSKLYDEVIAYFDAHPELHYKI